MSRGMSRFRVICRCLSWCALLAAYASSSCRNSMRAFTQSRCTGSAAGRSRSGYGRSHSSTNRARCACSAASPPAQLGQQRSSLVWCGIEHRVDERLRSWPLVPRAAHEVRNRCNSISRLLPIEWALPSPDYLSSGPTRGSASPRAERTLAPPNNGLHILRMPLKPRQPSCA